MKWCMPVTRIGKGSWVVEHLIHQQLPFPIRVTGMHHFIRLRQQALNHFQLLSDRGTRL